MKTYTEIFQDATSPEAVFMAWDEFKKGKRKKPDVQQFERHLEDNVLDLYDELLHKTYKHNSYTAFYVKDPKIRRIHKATVRDRVVHHAVFRVLYPIFEPTFIADSFSCRIGKGTHKGALRLQYMVRKVSKNGTQPCYALKCDIKKFFDSLDHTFLLEIIRRRINDSDFLFLVEEIIASYSAPYSRERERERERELLTISTRASLLAI